MYPRENRWRDDIEREAEEMVEQALLLHKAGEMSGGRVHCAEALDHIRSRLGVLLWVLDPGLTVKAADGKAWKAVYMTRRKPIKARFDMGYGIDREMENEDEC